MTALFDGELAGVHDSRGDADPRALRQVLPNVTVVEAGALAFACSSPGSTNDACAGLAGRMQQPGSVREALELEPDEQLELVLAVGYARWGSALLDRLRGAFALVVWKREERRGLLAQDQLGGRSLFTFRDGRRLVFATEVAVLLALVGARPEPDDLAVACHLVDHSVPDGRTLFAGIRRLGGGELLELSDDADYAVRRYWAPRYEPPLRAPRAELGERLRLELDAAIADAVPAEQPTAALLSGGLDSSVVVALAAPRAPNLRAVSAAFPAEPEIDETAWARRVADHVGVPLTTVPIERREPLRAADEYLRAWGLPLPVPGFIIEEPLIAAAGRLGAEVVLDGQGGDELFGVAHFLIADRVRRGRALSALRLARRHPGLGSSPPLRHVARVFTSVGVHGALPAGLHQRLRRRRPTERYVPGWLRPELAGLYCEANDPWGWKQLNGPRWWAYLADALTRGRERADLADYLRRRGRMGGLEARSPLLDVRLVELALRLPPEANFDPVTSRPLAREALRGALPADVLARRDKADFAALQHRTLSSAENVERIRRLLNERAAAVGAYVDLRQVHRELLSRPPAVGDSGWRVWSVHVWNLATAELWLQSQYRDGPNSCHLQDKG
jgi:asparagine synthase (glutamine-hydrolysing)